MKKVLFVLGVLLVMYALVSGSSYFFNYTNLSLYGQGFVVGKILLLLLGGLLIFVSQRKKR